MCQALGRPLAVLLLLGLAGALPGLAASPESGYVLHIEASSCKAQPGSRAQTGFRLRGQRGIVTALHGVVDCSFITARQGDGGQALRGLTIALADVRHDVALLRSPALKDDAGFEMAATLPGGSSRVWVLGHPSNIPGLHSMELSVPSPAVRLLGDLVPPDLFMALQKRGSPSVATRVISLNGDLQPGHSGAPILDASRKVVGVANGGLAGGTVGIGWGIVLADVSWSPLSAAQVNDLARNRPDLIFSYGSVPGSRDRSPRTWPPLELALRDGEQKTFFDDQASVAASFNQIGREKFVTLVVGTAEGEPVPHAVLGPGARITFQLGGVEYAIFVLQVSEDTRTVKVRINQLR